MTKRSSPKDPHGKREAARYERPIASRELILDLLARAGKPLPAAAIVCFIVGYLFGLPALKIEGHYLALATFALVLAVPQLLT